MLDPFPPPPPYLAQVIRPLANQLGLITLPLHLHQIFLGFACYHLINTIVSPSISALLFPSVYLRLSSRTRTSWNMHVTSLIQSSFITTLAIFVILSDKERREMDRVGRIWGYTGAGGVVQGFAAGYFMWDLMVSIKYLDLLGWGTLAHAISALLLTSLGFRPFANYYGLNFILYEISTPFLNIHWFCDKLSLTGSRVQLYNGVVLLITFLASRVLWGNYQSVCIYLDVWASLKTPVFEPQHSRDNLSGHQTNMLALEVEGGQLILPMWLAVAYLGSNTVLNVLNIHWFIKMVQALGRRFRGSGPLRVIEDTAPGNLVKAHADL